METFSSTNRNSLNHPGDTPEWSATSSSAQQLTVMMLDCG